MWRKFLMKKLVSKVVGSALLASAAVGTSGSAGLFDDLHKGGEEVKVVDSVVGRAASYLPRACLAYMGMVLCGEVAKTIWQSFTGESDFIPNLVRRFIKLKEYIEDFIEGRTKLNLENFEEFFDRYEEYLNLKIIGQPKAIKKVIALLKSHYANVFMSKVTGQRFNHGCFFYIIGPSGVGKTLLLREISKALRLPVVDLSRTEIIKHSAKIKENRNDFVSVMLTPAVDAYGKEEYTRFYKSLRQSGDCLIIINEFEKVRAADYRLQGLKGNDIYDPSGHRITCSMDESLRDYVDNGKLLGFDKPNAITAATSNETWEEILKMDPSWVSRISSFVVEFDYLREDSDCEKCMKLMLRGNYEEFLKRQRTEILFDDTSLKNFVSSLPVEKRTGRYFNDVVNSLGSEVYSFSLRHKGAKSIIIKWSKNEGFYIPEPKKGN